MAEDEPRPDDIGESRLFTFIDEPRQHALYVLEGQRLIRDVALAHGHGGAGLAFLRDMVLSVQPLVGLVKGGEQLGFYVDAEEPEGVRLKIEASHSGDTRCVLVPPDLPRVPDLITGLVRVETRRQGSQQPYVSALRVEETSPAGIVDRVLADSYQVKSAVLLSRESDQSLMLHRLPPLRGEDPALDSLAHVLELLERMRPEAEAIMARALTDSSALVEAFAGLGWRLIASRRVRFHCTCTREHVVRSLRLLDDPSELFDAGQSTIDVTCDYCARHHVLWRHELVDPPGPAH